VDCQIQSCITIFAKSSYANSESRLKVRIGQLWKSKIKHFTDNDIFVVVSRKEFIPVRHCFAWWIYRFNSRRLTRIAEDILIDSSNFLCDENEN